MRAQLLLREVELARLPLREADDRDVALLVVQRREQTRHRRERVGERAAELSRVHRLVEHAHLDDARHDPAQRRGERGLALPPIAAVGHNDGIACEVRPLLLEVRAQVLGARFLLALDEHRDADRRLAAEGAERRDVRDDTGLVVRAAAPVEPTVLERRRERLRRPLAVRPRRLHVVMRVEEGGRLARRRLHVADDRGMSGAAEDLRLGAYLAQQLGDRVGRAAERLRVEVARAHRGDRDEPLEIGAYLRDRAVDARAEIGHRLRP